MKSKSKLKALIIGLDGATFDLMLPFIKEGKLPTLAYLLENGAWGELESTIPPVTAAAWPSFLTGENPGKHGILKFIQPKIVQGTKKNSQETVTTKSFAGRTFLDALSYEGMKVGAITIPVTYPPWDINGVMISGYPCPDHDQIFSVAKGFTFEITEPLNFNADYYKTASEEQILEDSLHKDRLRSKLTLDLLSRFKFDCFVVVLGGIDRACHDYWKYHDPDYPGVPKKDREKFKNAIFRNYQLADEEIRKFLEALGDETNIFILSDHGSGRHPFLSFNANLWLKNNNFLKIKGNKTLVREILRKAYHGVRPLLTPKNKKSTRLLQKIRAGMGTSDLLGGRLNKIINWDRTKAFYYPLMYPADGIVINLKGRLINGSVNPGKEYDNLVADLIEGLLKLRDKRNGEKVVERAFHRSHLYSGPFVDRFPDIVYILNPRYVGGNEIFGSEIMAVPDFHLSKKSGLHLMNGVFISYGPKIKAGRIKNAKITDVAPTVLYSCGVAIPDNMDGTVLENIFRKDILEKNPIKYSKFKGKNITKDIFLEQEEKEQIKEKLRSLGYID